MSRPTDTAPSFDQAFRLDGRSAVVTGAASGIGAAVAEVLAEAGARVVLGDLDAAGAKAQAERIVAAGGSATSQACDIAQRADLDALVAHAVDQYGGLDVMCNVAGVPSDGPLSDVSEEELDRALAINIKGSVFGCQAAVPAMAASGGGSIINVASAGMDGPVANYGVYAMTKSAVKLLTEVLAMEVGDKGIRVNALAPGATMTNFTKRHLYDESGAIDQAKYDAFVANMAGMSPLGIVGEARDQAYLALYLASDAARYCTGQIWRANGGQVLGR